MNAVRLSAIGLRELAAFVLSPIGALVGAAFILLQGLSFWGLVRVLANPSEPAPYGAVLHSFFGGTLLYWAVVFAVVSALTMRTYAEERQQGTWELLATSGGIRHRDRRGQGGRWAALVPGAVATNRCIRCRHQHLRARRVGARARTRAWCLPRCCARRRCARRPWPSGKRTDAEPNGRGAPSVCAGDGVFVGRRA